MIGKYEGHFSYDKVFVSMNAPAEIGIYYMGSLNSNGNLGVLNVGRALGKNVSIKSRLLDHLNKNEWPDITHFGYKICSSEAEVENLEKDEIARLNIPKYNQRIG